MAEEEGHNDREMVNPNRTLREYLHPIRTTTASCIITPLNAHNFSSKPGMIPLLPHFHGMDSENPYLHLKEFEEAIELKKVHEIQGIPKQGKCNICEDISHVTSECPNIPVFKEVLCDASHPVNMISKPFPAPYSNTYNTGWRNHPNFSWRNDHPTNLAHSGAGAPQYSVHTQQNALIPVPRRPMDDPFQQMASTLQQFMQSQTTINNQTSQAINDIRNNLTKLNTTLSAKEKGKFPSQPQPNPQSKIAAIESSSSSEANVKTCKAVITLCSGKEVETLGNEVGKKVESSISNAQGKNSNVDVFLEPKVTPPAPFPQRLVPLHKDKHHTEILDIFRQVRINIPLLDAIEQISTYAKFLKDLCTVKRRINVQKKAFLTEQVSAIIQSNTPPKYKDPSSPTIACVIGSTTRLRF
ncbi:uncharacterized protein LOC122316241 [Carya illinoinensis]|uniref:uncharacterized protein LOC122316241 n=1 Tax=Carya illinoinensis TaxID=32201 RepID=UPI001C725DF5|nr:uncharacterized protein LOC122316241 [Carya illinoinensis]